MTEHIKQAIREGRLGFPGILVYATLTLIVIVPPMMARAKTISIAVATLAVPLFFLYAFLEIYIMFFFPPKANVYTFSSAYAKWLVAFLLYWTSVNTIIYVSDYSEPMKFAHIALISIGFWGLLLYFRYAFIPTRFKAREGFELGIKNGIIDPERSLYKPNIDWTKEVVFSRSERSDTSLSKYSWLCALFIGAGTSVIHLFDFEKIHQGVFFSSILFDFVSLLLCVLAAPFIYDHFLVRKWEKENGRTLYIK